MGSNLFEMFHTQPRFKTPAKKQKKEQPPKKPTKTRGQEWTRTPFL